MPPVPILDRIRVFHSLNLGCIPKDTADEEMPPIGSKASSLLCKTACSRSSQHGRPRGWLLMWIDRVGMKPSPDLCPYR